MELNPGLYCFEVTVLITAALLHQQTPSEIWSFDPHKLGTEAQLTIPVWPVNKGSRSQLRSGNISMPWRRHAYIIDSDTVTNGFSAAVDLWHIWDHFPFFFPEEAELNFHVFVISSFPLCSLNTSSQQVSGGQRQSPYHVHCLTTAHPLHWPCHAAQ